MTSVRLAEVSKVFPNGKVGLQGISFSVSDGERVGLIGPNGAGKSTLLSIIAGVTEPSSGAIQVDGEVSAILSLGLSVREELTGRAYLQQECALRGMSDHEVQVLLPHMVSFADIGAFIDRPLRTYSTGMKARVIFAANAWIKPEILLLDEVLSVGDRDFNEKASAKIRELTTLGSILIFSSHSMAALEQMCDRCIRLDSGLLVDDGDVGSVVGAYLESVSTRHEDLARSDWLSRSAPAFSKDGWSIDHVQLNSPASPDRDLTAISKEPARLTIRLKAPPREVFKVTVKISRLDGRSLLEHDSPKFCSKQDTHRDVEVRLSLASFPLSDGYCSLEVLLRTEEDVRARVVHLLKVIDFRPTSGGKPTYAVAGQLSSIISEVADEASR